MRVLYLSYDGMTDPLGGSQVLPYLAGLSKLGHSFWLISCEKPGADARAWERVGKLCAEAGIGWHPLRYHKRPPVLSTMWDVRAVQRAAVNLHQRIDFDLVHCRSYVPALVGLALKRRHGVPFLFDMRGFWPEERLEGGGWDGPLFRRVYRWFKQRERSFFKRADAIVSLTASARDQMMTRPEEERPATVPTVIPCCVDFDHFDPPSERQRLSARERLAIPANAAVLCYLGSLGGYYMLDEMLRFFVAMRERRPGARFLFVTREAEAPIRFAAGRHGVRSDELIIQPADRNEVPGLLSAADAGISFIRPAFSKTASSPTKLGEMMAMGLPMVVNRGVGDVDQVIGDTDSGVIVDGFDDESLRFAAEQLSRYQSSADHIRAGARRWFDLHSGVEAYDRIYRRIGGGDRG